MRVLVSAWEASADRHGAGLLRELKRRHPELQAFGAGGPELQAEGLELLVDMRDAGQVMGYVPILAKIPKILRGMSRLRRAMRAQRPDFAILIDYPGVNLKLLRFCSRLRIPGFVYIPPKVWVWKSGRVRTLRKHAHRVLTIFPFEVPFLQERGCAQVAFVGNPLIEELPMTLTRETARQELGLTGGLQDQVMVVMMPGSRPAEIRVHVEPFLDAIQSARLQTLEPGRPSVPWRVVIPAVHGQAAARIRERLAIWLQGQVDAGTSVEGVDIEVVDEHAGRYLAAADVGIIKSGTSTLEAALMRCPHVVAYQASVVLLAVMRGVLRLRGSVALSNILWQRGAQGDGVTSGEVVFPEHVSARLDVPAIARDLLRVLRVPHVRERQREVCDRVRAQLQQPARPFEAAAQEILDHYLLPRETSRAANWLNRWGSVAWDFLHRLRTRIRFAMGQRPIKISAHVIGVGNVQVGGSGKTPLVMELARQAHERGKQVGVLIRGYGGRWEDEGGWIAPVSASSGRRYVDPELSGDEAALIAEQCPWAWIGVGKDRLHAYRKLSERARLDVVILDDAAQNIQIHQDVEVIALTSAQPGTSLFRQTSREKTERTLNVWTKGDVVPGGEASPFGSIDVRTELVVEGELPDRLNKKYWWIVGIGDPASARDVLAKAGLRLGDRIVRQTVLKDHAWPSQQQMVEVLVEATDRDWTLLMTGKDWIKWARLPEAVQARAAGRIEVIEPRVRFVTGRDLWEAKCWGP